MMKKLKKAMAIVLTIILCMGLSVGALGSVSYEPDADGVVTVSGVEKIPDSAAYGQTGIKKLVIEEGVKSIGIYSFGQCTKLTEVHLPVSLETVNIGAFGGCSALTTVYYAGTEEQAASISINSDNNELTSAQWIYEGSDSSGDEGGSGDATEPDSGTDTEPDSGETVKLALSVAATTVIAGETAEVQLKLVDACSRLGAQLKISAADAAGNALEIGSVTLGVDGVTNDSNNGTIVIASNEELPADTVLATVSFKTVTAGTYTVSLEGDMYTGADNSAVEWTLSAGKITVKEPTVNVKWLNYNGDELDSQTVDIGSVPVYGGSTPTRESDRLYDYSFSGWDKTSAAVTADTTYTAQFTSSARSYAVSIDCGIDGAEYTVKNANGISLTPAADGSFRLSATETYTCTVSAVGCVERSFTVSVADESADWSFDGSSAVLSIAAPEPHIGDTDDDGDVDMQDAQALFNYLAGNISVGSDGIAYNAAGAVVFNSNVADINGSGSVGADDILPMLDLVNG